jgi:hypothetical protein
MDPFLLTPLRAGCPACGQALGASHTQGCRLGLPNAGPHDIVEECDRDYGLPSQQDRIEAKLDALIKALAEEEDQAQPGTALDGQPAGQERDQSQSLG